MTWTKLGDDFMDRPALLAVSRSARLLHVEALLRCNRMLTDGLITRAELPRISDAKDIDADVTELEEAGLWQPAGLKAWQIDWTDQEAGDDVRKRQEQNAARQRRWRKHTSGDHSECDPARCSRARSNGEVTPSVTRYETPTRSGPSRPEGTGGQGPVGGSTDAADAAPLADRPAAPDFGHGFDLFVEANERGFSDVIRYVEQTDWEAKRRAKPIADAAYTDEHCGDWADGRPTDYRLHTLLFAYTLHWFSTHRGAAA